MSADTPLENPHRRVPSVDALLQQMPEEAARWGHRQLTAALREILAELRAQISRGDTPATELKVIRARVNEELGARNRASLIPVLNLTGTVLHTNLGRASLPREAVDAVATVAAAPSNLEFDLETGARGDRESHIEALLCELTGAEAATAVNNNAAAVLLVLNTLAMNREVPVSRGELVEIGGSFRIPDVMQRANCTLGTRNFIGNCFTPCRFSNFGRIRSRSTMPRCPSSDNGRLFREMKMDLRPMGSLAKPSTSRKLVPEWRSFCVGLSKVIFGPAIAS